MARGAKQPAKRSRAAKFPKVPAGELVTLLDFVRYAVSRFVEAKLVFAHGTTDPVADAAFLVCEALHLHPDQFEMFASARVTAAESAKLLDLIEARVTTRKPTAYLVNKIYMRGLPFYVDERVIVPRSFIGELLDSHFSGSDEMDVGALIDDLGAVDSVLDLCTGSGCLAILASRHFPNARIDAVDLSKDALKVAAKNVADYGLDDRIALHNGDLFAPLGDARYDLIISNPPYVDAQGMADLPRECRLFHGRQAIAERHLHHARFLSKAVRERLVGARPTRADLDVVRHAGLAGRRFVVHAGEIIFRRLRDGEVHVGLAGSEPDLADQDVGERERRAWGGGSGGHDTERARFGAGGHRIESDAPAAAGIGRGRVGLAGEGDRDGFPGIGRSPDGNGHFALQHHVVGERAGEAYDGGRGGDGQGENKENGGEETQ